MVLLKQAAVARARMFGPALKQRHRGHTNVCQITRHVRWGSSDYADVSLEHRTGPPHYPEVTEDTIIELLEETLDTLR